MIQDNIKHIEEEISEACKAAGRDRNEVNLVAVSKYHPLDFVIEAYNCGILNFGESKAQELKEKAEKFDKPVWHFIGHLQTNKTKIVVKYADFIHSVDSLKLAKEINKRAAAIEKIQKIFLEVKTSYEESKYGLSELNDILEIAKFCKESDNIDLKGLMTMAPYTEDEEEIRNSFRKLKEIRNELNKEGFPVKELSMGMSGDFKIAISEGSTYIRIGTAIFGERIYK